MGLNIPGYILFFASGTGRPTACFLAVVENFPKRMSEFMQWALHTVETWCDEVGLSVNLDKTELVFTRRWKLARFFEPPFCGGWVYLRRCISVRYLEVVLDSRPTWRERVDITVRKAKNLLWACRRVCGATWVLSPKLVLRLYVSIFDGSLLLHP
jgi:hypothetical protein